MNVDPIELQKFSELAHRWWDVNSEFKPLHAINPLRLAWIENQVSLENKKVLDVGCGGGILTEAMHKQGAVVTGIDLAEKALKVAQLHALEMQISIDYRLIAAETLAEAEAGQYDVITCMEMLEHVPDPASIVKACAKLVKPGGHLFFSTINRNLKAYLYAIIGAEYILRLLPIGTHDYQKLITPAELAQYARLAGLEVQAFKGLTYNPITREYRLVDDVSVNYLVACCRTVKI